MSDVNQTVLVGRVGQDPMVRQTAKGSTVLNFSVATSKSKKVGSAWESVTQWHNVVCFGKQAEWNQHTLKKGVIVTVVGENETQTYEKDGVKHYKHQVNAKSVVVGTPKTDAENQSPDDQW